MSEWSTTRVGQHVRRRVEPVTLDPEEMYSSLGIRYRSGVYVRDVKAGRAIRTKMYRARGGDFIYCILDSQRGPFDIVPEDLDGSVVTNKFPTYEVCPSLHPKYLKLTFQRPNTLEMIGKARQGAEGRSEWKPAQFEAHQIPLPPKEVQQHIVDIVESVDAMRAALETEAAAARSGRTAILDELLRHADHTWKTTSIGELGSITRGKRFTKAQYVETGTPCIHYAQIHTDFGAMTAEAHSWLPSEMNPRLRFAQPCDLVIAGTSETQDGVLKAVAWMGDEPVAVHDDAYIFRHELEPRFASYLFAAPAFRKQVAGVLSDTKVVRVSRADLERLTVPVPPLETQTSIADAVAAVDEQVLALETEVARSSAARDALVEGLLSGSQALPLSPPPDGDHV